MKKFKPPSFINGTGPPSTSRDTAPPPVKKRKVDGQDDIEESNTIVSSLPVRQSLQKNARKPLLTIKPVVTNVSTSVQTDTAEQYFTVVWRKKTNKKHKTWDGDGILSAVDSHLLLQDMSGKDIGRTRANPDGISVGDMLSIAGKDCEVEAALSRDDYLSGKPFLKNSKPAPLQDYSAIKQQGRLPFKNPVLGSIAASRTADTGQAARPRHDPCAPNALVLTRPASTKVKGLGHIVDVVVDPFIGQFLRPHQRDGVAFLYDCIMRFKDYNGAGAILADEMGLGKTLQTIALIWTLLKQHFLPGQGPLAKKILVVCPVTLTNNWRKEFRKWLGQDRIGVFVVDSKANLRDFLCGKIYQVMIIGYEKLRLLQETDELKTANFDVIICDEGHKLKSANNKAAQAIRSLNTTRRIILSGTPIQNDLGEFFVMIDFVNPGLLGTYQTFRKEFENPILKARQPEATKRDKEQGAARSLELSRLTDLFILRRTTDLLSGYLPPKTEYVVFCKPTDLQIRLHQKLVSSPAATQCLGGQNSAFQLQGITHLRKICNAPSLLYTKSAGAPLSSGDQSTHSADNDTSFLSSVQSLLKNKNGARASGKLLVLESFLVNLRLTTEKVVIVSQFTQTLQVLQELLESHNMTFCRLDGSTPQTKRQEMVEKFNRTPATLNFAFLLSAKSGGCGLNLIGASRLVLYDSDWNPSVDLQAMARIHRDGQKSPVYIYRYLTTGMIDEKIYQRQVTKQGLSDSLMDSKASGSSFSLEELRDLFRCHEDTVCLTHDMLHCPCRDDGQNQIMGKDNAAEESDENVDEEEEPGNSWIRASQVRQQELEKAPKQKNMKALRLYDHVSGAKAAECEMNTDVESSIGDDILVKTLKAQGNAQGHVTYLFIKKSGLSTPMVDLSVDGAEDDNAQEVEDIEATRE